MGVADSPEGKVRCTDFSVNVRQDVLFFDHTLGLRDSTPTSLSVVKGDSGAHNAQKKFWRASAKIVQGGFNFPLTSVNSGAMLNEAIYGGSFDMGFYYTCDMSRFLKDCKVNTYTFRAAAGEFATVSVDIMARHMDVGSGALPYTDVEKLLTWDSFNISGLGGGAISYIEFTVSNACMPIYTAGKNLAGDFSQLEPSTIRVGMQSLTGTFGYYTADSLDYLETSGEKNIIITSGAAFSANLTVLLKPMTQNAAIAAPVIRTVAFVGVGTAIA